MAAPLFHAAKTRAENSSLRLREAKYEAKKKSKSSDFVTPRSHPLSLLQQCVLFVKENSLSQLHSLLWSISSIHLGKVYVNFPKTYGHHWNTSCSK
jgi:hypothetical protein